MKLRVFNACALMNLREFVLLTLLLIGMLIPNLCAGQTSRLSNSNTQQIDPVRTGDVVEVMRGRSWYRGTVVSVADGKAMVKYTRGASETEGEFSFSQIRFPNGEGQWALWKDSRGKINVEGRYIARDKENVMIRKADGTEMTIAIDDLALNLKVRVKKTPITGEENQINGVDPIRVGDQIQVSRYSEWYDGVVKSIEIGKANIQYERNGRSYTESFPFSDIRFPHGEGHWELWKDSAGELKIEARYLGRDKTHVVLLKGDGSELKLPIADLAVKLKRRVLKSPVTGEENFIDGASPFRVGDQVQVLVSKAWYDGVVKTMHLGDASVTHFYKKREQTKKFPFNEIRFPNGEGKWREWSSTSGKFKITARYISKTKTHVTIRKLDGKDITIENKKLAQHLRRWVAQIPVTGEETMIAGANPIRVGDTLEVKVDNKWQPGLILESHPGHALVEVTVRGNTKKIPLGFTDMRYPNGEGHWQKWMDDSGDNHVIARFLRRDATHVSLFKEDGTIIKMPIERLSKKFKTLVEKTLVITPQPKEIEFETSAKLTSFLSNATDFSGLVLEGLDAAAPAAALEGGFGFPLTHNDSISMVVPTVDKNPWYAVGTRTSSSYLKQGWSRLYWTRPNDSKVVPGPNFKTDEQIVDYSSKQSRLLTVFTSRDGESDAFGTYRVESGSSTATPEIAWKARKSTTVGKRSIFRVRLVGDNQLLLADGLSVSLYDFKSRKVRYTVGGLEENHFTLHPSKKYFVFMKSGGALSFHDSTTGKQLAEEPLPTQGFGGVGFSQDGRKMVAVTATSIKIWDLDKTGKPLVLKRRNLFTNSKSRIVLLDDDWIKGGDSLYSIPKEVVVWNYSTNSGVKIAHNEMLGKYNLLAGIQGSSGYRSYRNKDKIAPPKTALVGIAKVPHKGALEALESLDTVSMIMLKPGSGIKIEATGDSRVREGLMRVVKANGWHEDPSSEILLKGFAGRGKSETLEYGPSRFGFSPFGRRRPSSDKIQKITAAPWNQNVEIIYNEQTAWRTGQGGYLPSSFTLRDGDTLHSKMSEATKPTYGLFEKLEIPAEMLYPKFKYGLGKTSITVNGFRDQVIAKPQPEGGDEVKAEGN